MMHTSSHVSASETAPASLKSRPHGPMLAIAVNGALSHGTNVRIQLRFDQRNVKVETPKRNEHYESQVFLQATVVESLLKHRVKSFSLDFVRLLIDSRIQNRPNPVRVRKLRRGDLGFRGRSKDSRKIRPSRIIEFLQYLEDSRNVRLAAIHSFFRYLAAQYPECLEHSQRILAVPRDFNSPPDSVWCSLGSAQLKD